MSDQVNVTFHTPEDLSQGTIVSLSAEQSHHLMHVLRIKEGKHVLLFNGAGARARAKVIESHPKRCRLEVVELMPLNFPPLRVSLCFGLPKGNALDFIIRRVTEIGVRSFHPLITDHSLRATHWNEKRWARVVIEVCKQAEQPLIPQLFNPSNLDHWLQAREPSALFFCDEQARTAKLAKIPTEGPCDLLIGPEGGWSADERQRIIRAGAVGLGLGKNRLRTETAAVVAVTLLKMSIGEL
ncbi:MAG: 16S rRNA (uracil(1498)-N(3))-methyltransferase [Deltaproteobacteria bacterium]|nr:16S rRNA (uracil(1498)-N(3))-methyltransferase [Deltaproteobacteria bacterium]